MIAVLLHSSQLLVASLGWVSPIAWGFVHPAPDCALSPNVVAVVSVDVATADSTGPLELEVVLANRSARVASVRPVLTWSTRDFPGRVVGDDPAEPTKRGDDEGHVVVDPGAQQLFVLEFAVPERHRVLVDGFRLTLWTKSSAASSSVSPLAEACIAIDVRWWTCADGPTN